MSSSQASASVWAAQQGAAPLIATQGQLSLEYAQGTLGITFDDIQKPEDSSGSKLMITGSIVNVAVP